MTFLTFSFFLGGLAAAIIPVALHLLLRGKPKVIEFPALMFIKNKLEVHRRQYRLKHIILLLCRVGLFLLLGFALARPSLKLFEQFPSLFGAGTTKNFDEFEDPNDSGDIQHFVSSLAMSLGSQDAPIAAAIIIDASFRMNYVASNRTRLEVAKDFADWILSQLPKKSQIAVLSTRREPSAFQVDAFAAGETIKRITTAPVTQPVTEVAKDAVTLLGSSEFSQHELYILTDLSEPSWNLDGLQSRLPIQHPDGENKTLMVYVVDVGAEKPNNTSVRSVQLSSQIPVAQMPVTIDAELAHLGDHAVKEAELVLQDVPRGIKTVDFPDGEARRNISFEVMGFEPGTYQGYVRLTTEDALKDDDRFPFTICVQQPWKALVFGQNPINRTTLFLTTALTEIPFEVTQEPYTVLVNMSSNDLRQYNAVFLLDPGPLPPAVWKKLADYASKGHGVGVFLGEAAIPVTTFNDPAATEVLGATLLRQVPVHEELYILPNDLTSPVLASFRQHGEVERFPWHTQNVFRYWEVGKPVAPSVVVAPYIDNRAAILARTIGRGHSVTVTTPISEYSDSDNVWNDLPARSEATWMFLLLIEGIAKYLVGAGEQSYNFRIGENVVIRPNDETIPQTCLMATPSGESIRLTPDVPKREIAVSRTSEPGNYRLRSGGAKATLDTGFSVRLSGDAMNLRRIDSDRLDQTFGKDKYKLARTPQEIEQSIVRKRIGQDLYELAILLLAVLFAVEYVVSNRFYGVPATEENQPASTAASPESRNTSVNSVFPH